MLHIIVTHFIQIYFYLGLMNYYWLYTTRWSDILPRATRRSYLSYFEDVIIIATPSGIALYLSLTQYRRAVIFASNNKHLVNNLSVVITHFSNLARIYFDLDSKSINCFLLTRATCTKSRTMTEEI